MYIVFETDNDFDFLHSKYLLLELDTIEISSGHIVKSYCVVDKDAIPYDEMPLMQNKRRLHEALMRNYHEKNWDICNQCLLELRGSFKGEIDSFYDIMHDRITKLETIDLPDNWTGYVRSPAGSTIPS